MRARHNLFAAAAATTMAFTLGAVTVPAGAAVIETRTNPVAAGAISTTDSSFADWDAVTPYQLDTDPANAAPTTVDYLQVWVAHDTTNFYFRYRQAGTTAFGAMFNSYLDTDADRSTGFISFDQFSVGAEYLVQGASTFRHAGATQGEFAWTFVNNTGEFAQDEFDIEFAVRRADLGNVDAFNFLVLGDNFNDGTTGGGIDDYYPQGSSGGATGDALRYTVVVPEPAGLSAVALTALALVRRRSRRGR